MQTKNIRGPARRGCVREQNRMGKIKTPEEIREELFERYPALESCRGEFDAMYEACARAYESGGKVLVAGNGGSAADAEHIVGELMKSFLVRRPADAALCAALREKFGEEGAPQVVLPFSGGLPFGQAADALARRTGNAALLVTSDGSVTQLAREALAAAEEGAVRALRAAEKPFVILVNSRAPRG